MLFSLLYIIINTIIVRCFQLEMVDQLQQRLTSSNSTNQLLAKDYLENRFPILTSDCVRSALERFLPICLKKGIESVDATLRVETAVKLSICEFKASGLEHIPNSCESEDVESMMDCMVQLESSAQWWTTYSGNYQRLSTICYENSLPYEKEQILALFLNITSMYGDMSGQLNERFAEIISNSESASQEHIKNMARMFRDFMSRLTEESRSHETVLEDDFRAHREQVSDLIVKNSAKFEQEMDKRDFELRDSARQALDIIGMVKNALYDMDITSEIGGMNQHALSKWREVDEVAEKVLKSQYHGQAQLSEDWNQFLSSTRDNMSVISAELIKSQNQAVEVLDDYDQTMKNRMVTMLAEETFPQLQALQHQIVADWKEMSFYLAEDLSYWNKEVASSFEIITKNLSRTIETVSDLDHRITKLQDFFAKVQKAFGLGWQLWQYNLLLLRYLIVSKLFWVLIMTIICGPRIISTPPSLILAVKTVRFVRAIAKWMMLPLLIFVGSRLGTHFVPLPDQPAD